MKTDQAKSRQETVLPPEMASAVNLMAHPMAGAAAMGAIGLGVASHAMGLWLGALAGAAEATRRLVEDMEAGQPESAVRVPPKLRVVASSEIADAPVAAVLSKAAEPAVAKAPAPARKPRAAGNAGAKAAAEAKAPSDGRPAATERPAQPDDLKAISGVGPKLETVLNGFGIWTYAQIAALGDAEIGWLDNELGFAGRIVRDDWLGQAKALAQSAEGREVDGERT